MRVLMQKDMIKKKTVFGKDLTEGNIQYCCQQGLKNRVVPGDGKKGMDTVRCLEGTKIFQKCENDSTSKIHLM